MAGKIREEDVTSVRERARIDEIVRETVTLKAAGGGSYKGLCPFHDERSPSFHVTPSKGLYHCFSCGEGGDVITFVRKIDALSFTEAVDVKMEKIYSQPKQEPVAWMDADGNVSDNNDHKCFPIPLYTQPPQLTWVNPPDEEIKILWIQYRAALPRYLCFAKALLARAKEKNT